MGRKELPAQVGSCDLPQSQKVRVKSGVCSFSSVCLRVDPRIGHLLSATIFPGTQREVWFKLAHENQPWWQ